ncbi:FAD-binding oxidoreductase [Krasilnikoviella flava]|uniref:FAD/FMN-containing dehydrogenase n=1 Tax=Krasilnikoviella flava TaxID=526729 RepID=A0A1T5LF89_9MICO|nr:FAD-binding protein [Krasilnikoviella flava]SKC74355.1 FAD/FMN-containing dehydrogenase [Krasilnikoviella flava]
MSIQTPRTAAPAPAGMGEALAPGDDGYDDARRTVFATGRPALVVRPHDEAEVAVAVAHAAREGLAVSVRSGGHGLTGRATNDGGLVIDLRHMDAVQVVDPHRRVVRVGAGATWGRVAAALAPHGLAITAGDTAGVGVGGLTLGGGIGWMVRRHGLTVDNLVAARVVLADGRTVVASADAHAGLFWALRGGGGLGVVTSLDLVAARVGDVLFGSLTFAADDLARLVVGWRDHLRGADDELSSTLVLAPAAGGGPASATVLVCASHDDPAAAARSVEPLRRLGTVVADTVATVPYARTLAEGGHHPPGVRLAARNVVVPRLDDDVVAALVAAVEGDRPTMVGVRALGGAVSRVLPDETAFAHRDAEALVVGGALVPLDAPGAVVEDALARWRDVAAHGSGAYVNFQGTATDADLRAAYPPTTLARLRAVARAYDPGTLVACHLGAPPVAGAGA